MDINAAYPSAFLKAADLQGKKITVTIDRVEMSDMGDGKDQKPVVYFVNKERGLALNKTNANMIVEIIGSSETDTWSGHRIAIYSTKVDFQGRRVDAIRVDFPKGSQPPPPVDIDDDSAAPF